MKESLQEGLKHRLSFTVPETKTVPALYPEATEFQHMPRVFATGFLVGLVEWACIQAVIPHLDWPEEQTVGIHVDLSHEAATPPGLEVTVDVELVAVNRKQLTFTVTADDGVDTICRGRHQRSVINTERFSDRAASKQATTEDTSK
ncbi:Thioesterase superfamily [Actinopolyspora mzabensis]|uniref:Thioesterase superfamily n=1 Tax=Actinopolyspora mzabensis TaxID=995066 RepID=A0A1G9EPA4_ACTMZ|nr:thioesterase family protein [Actinopolyspora mzabensis]SDK78047.1 Thioesterase superfamily [Actinopolyspora mzabensis]